MALKLSTINTKYQIMKLVIPSIIIVITIILISCGGHKNPQFEKENTLTFTKATYTRWVAGIRGGGAGYSINIIMDPSTNKDLKLDSLYFKTYAVSLISNEDKIYTGHIDTGENRDVISPIYGSGNTQEKQQPNNDTQKNPYKLDGDEAVIVYKENGIIKYYKTLLTKDTSTELPR